MDKPDSLVDLFGRYIKHTPEKSIVADVTILLAYLPKALVKDGIFMNQKVYVNTRVLKHMYDKKPAEEFDTVLVNLHKVVSLVGEVYRNLEAKRGDYCLVTQIGKVRYICSIEVEKESNKLVTAFRLRDDKYLLRYRILWSRKGGIPSS